MSDFSHGPESNVNGHNSITKNSGRLRATRRSSPDDQSVITTTTRPESRFTSTGMARLPDSPGEIVPIAALETPEERRLRVRVERLRAEVTEAAAELEELRATLGAFEARYEARIGVLIVELDRVNVENARLQRTITALLESTEDVEHIEAAIEREFAAEQARIEQEFRDASGAGRHAAALAEPPPPDLARAVREQYRKLARRFHPDVAITDDQRAHNEAAMKRINEAMEANDLDMLGVLEASLPSRTSDMPHGSTRARIHWATSEIARLEQVLTRTIGRMAAVKSSSVYELWSRTEHDPGTLDRLERDIAEEIALARMQSRALENDLERARASRGRMTRERRAGV